MIISNICIADSYKTKEVLCEEFTNRVCEFDARVRQLTGKAAKDYVLNNKFQYYVGINSWLLLARDIHPEKEIYLRDMITRHGLLQTIFECNNYSQDIINNTGEDNALAELVSGLSKRAKLQLLRYMKRFTIIDDTLAKAALDDFYASNKKCAVEPYSDFGNGLTQIIIRSMREHCHAILAGYRSDDQDTTADIYYAEKGSLSGGSCILSDGTPITTVNEKVRAISAINHYFIHPQFGTGESFRPAGDAVRPGGVPKSYKTYRIVAPEDSYRQWCQSGMRRELERCVEENGYTKYVNIHDQDVSRDLCLKASVSGLYSTLDFSHASDLISTNLAAAVLPSAVFRDAIALLPKYFIHYDGRKRRRHMFASAGSAITFILESVIFTSLCLAVNDICRPFLGRLEPPRIYGDDCIVDTKVFETFLQCANCIGFELSESKSYASLTLLYREACGAEYEHGIDMASVYWPRHALKLVKNTRDETLNILIQHQHKVVQYPSLSLFLSAIVRKYIPDMTSHKIGTICDDLWEVMPVYVCGFAPIEGDPSNESIPANIREWAEREKHYVYRTVTSKTPGVKPPYYSSALEAYGYRDFLLHGPGFNDELDRLLGVSTLRTPRADAIFGSVHRFKLETEH